MAESVRATFSSKGVKVAYATLPGDYQICAQITEQWQSDWVPFTAAVEADSPDNKIRIMSFSRQMYEDYVNPLQRSLINQVPNLIKSQLRDYLDPVDYVTDFAKGMIDSPITLLGTAKLPSYYGQHLQEVANAQYQYFMSHKIDINCKIELTSQLVDAILCRYETSLRGQKAYMLVGMDLRGFEYYDALGMNPLNALGGLKNLFGKKQENTQNNNTQAVFGHSKQAGKKVDVIQWGAERIYTCVYMADAEKEALQTYINFVSSFTPDQDLENRANQLIEQRYQQMYQQSVQMAGMATQMQMNANAFAQQTSRNISNQMSSISDGIMDSWNQKMASDSRISNNFSQAIRGVDTYTDSSGRAFEFTTQADHVYTNQYGDHIGVSGTEIDQDILNDLNWTKAEKK